MCAGCPTDPLPAGQGGLPPWPWDPPQITHPAFPCHDPPCRQTRRWVPLLGADSGCFGKKKLLEPIFKVFFPSPFRQDEEH